MKTCLRWRYCPSSSIVTGKSVSQGRCLHQIEVQKPGVSSCPLPWLDEGHSAGSMHSWSCKQHKWLSHTEGIKRCLPTSYCTVLKHSSADCRLPAWASQILLQGLPAPRHCLYCFGLGFINKPALQPSQLWHLVKLFFFFSFQFYIPTRLV